MKKAKIIIALVAMIFGLALPNTAAAYTEEESNMILDAVVETLSTPEYKAQIIETPGIADFNIARDGLTLIFRVNFDKSVADFNFKDLDDETKKAFMDMFTNSFIEGVAGEPEGVEVMKEIEAKFRMTVVDPYGNEETRTIYMSDF